MADTTEFAVLTHPALNNTLNNTSSSTLSSTSNNTMPQYIVEEFSSSKRIAEWLNSKPDYRVVSMNAIVGTNHFNKDTETLLWVTLELRERPN